MLKPMFSIVDKDGKPYNMQVGCGRYQWYFFEKDLDMLHTTCEMLNASKHVNKYKPYSVKQTIPIVLTEDECRCLYDGTYYAITHEKSYETWRDEKIASNIIFIKEVITHDSI